MDDTKQHWQKHRNLVFWAANYMSNRLFRMSEYWSEPIRYEYRELLGTVYQIYRNCVESHDVSKSKFSTYFIRAVMQTTWTFLKSESERLHRLVLNKGNAESEAGGNMEHALVMYRRRLSKIYESNGEHDEGWAFDVIDAVGSRDELWAILTSGMTPRNKEIIEARYRDGMTLESIGERCGLTKERVRQIQAETLGRMKQKLMNVLKFNDLFMEDKQVVQTP